MTWKFWLILLLVVYALPVFVVTYCVGPFHYRYAGWIARYLRSQGMAFITIGAMCFKAEIDSVPTPEQDAHERHHNHQWRVRPFFAPVYLFWMLVKGYDKHEDEQDARREAGQKER